MKQVIYMITIVVYSTVGCTKNNYIDTGISNGRHEGKSLLEYMETDSYNWDSTILLVRHAGEEMVRLFEGQDPDHGEITFFGLTNHSIRRYLLQNGLERVTDLDAGWCRSIGAVPSCCSTWWTGRFTGKISRRVSRACTARREREA